MRPTLHLGMPSGIRDARWQALSGPMQGFDAVRILSQILSLQALHYLALAFITPPLLGLLTFNKYALDFQGGAASLSMILDWREIAGYPTLNGGRPWPWNKVDAKPKQFQLDILRDSNLYTGNVEGAGMEEKFWWEYELFLHSQENKFIKVDDPEQIAWEGKRLGSGSVLDKVEKERLTLVETGKSNGAITDEKKVIIYKQTGWWTIFAKDSSRGWIIIIAWALTGAVDVYLLSILIRRPTHILDHTITLHFFHLLLTWFYTRQFPSSLFYWMVMAAHIGATVVWAEALSIRREMKAGWQSGLDDNVSNVNARSGREEDEEQSRLLGNGASSSHDSHHHSKSNSRTTTHVLFDDEENEDVDDKGGDKEKYRNGGHHSEEFEMKRLD